MATRRSIESFRASFQRVIRGFGLLAGDRTPCGQPLPVSHAHALMCLRARAMRGGPLAMQADLVAELGIDKSNVSRLCRRMARAGHIRERVADHDGRAREIELTAKGRQLAERVDAASRARFTKLAAMIPTSRRAQIEAALEELASAIAELDGVDQKEVAA